MGLLIGFCVSSGWYLTGGYGFLIEHPITLDSQYLMTNSGGPESLSFIGPTAYTLELLMYTSDSSKYVSYGIIVILGTFLGSFVSALHSTVTLFYSDTHSLHSILYTRESGQSPFSACLFFCCFWGSCPTLSRHARSSGSRFHYTFFYSCV